MLDLHDELDAWLPKFGQKWAFDKQKGMVQKRSVRVERKLSAVMAADWLVIRG